MISYLPLYLRKSKVFQNIIDAEQKQFNKIDETLLDVRNQMFIDTATWGLAIYEKELKIIPAPDADYEQRRAVIKARWQADSKIDRAILEAIASSILQTVVEVAFDGRIIFSFRPDGSKEIKNISTFYEVVEDIKPAHLPMQLEARLMSFIIELSSLHYNYTMPLPICGAVYCEGLPGKGHTSTVEMESKKYSGEVPLPVCGAIYANEVGLW